MFGKLDGGYEYPYNTLSNQEFDRYMRPVQEGKLFRNAHFKGGGGGKSKGKIIASVLGFAFGGIGAGLGWWGTGVKFLAGAMYGASLAGTLWQSTHKQKISQDDTRQFDAIQNQIDNKSMIPIIYGRRKWGGFQTYHKIDDDKKGLVKDIVFCEGEVDGIEDVRANDLRFKSYEYKELNPPLHLSVPFAAAIIKRKYGNEWEIGYAKYAGIEAIFRQEDVYSIRREVGHGNLPAENTYQFSSGATSQAAPSNYEQVGGYKNVAWLRAHLRISDDLPGGNPTITGIIRGRRVYDPRTGMVGWSDNPALIFLDYLTNKRFGTGRWVTRDMVDMDSIKECADYCDEVISWYVPDTLDNYDKVQNKITYLEQELEHDTNLSSDTRENIQDEINSLKRSLTTIQTQPVSRTLNIGKRYTCNLILAEEQSHIDNLEQILATFGGYMLFNGTQIALAMEKHTDVSYEFNDSNICCDQSGAPDIEWTTNALSDSPNQYNVTFYDPSNEWTSVCVQVNDRADQRLRQKIVSKDVTLQGVTSQSQALRLGSIFMAKNRLCPIRVTFSTATMAMHLQVGDVVTITHREVKDFPLRILSIAESQGKYTLSCQQYNDSIYDDKTGNLTAKNYNIIPSIYSSEIPDVYNLKTIVTGGTIKVTWDSIDYLYFHDYLVDYSLNNGSTWINAGITTGTEYEISTDKEKQSFLIRVRVENAVGRRSAGATVDAYVAETGRSIGSITSLMVIPIYGGFRLLWSPVKDVEDVQYNVYVGSGKSLAQDKCGIIAKNLDDTSYVYETTSVGNYTFWVQAHDANNTYNATYSMGAIEAPDGAKSISMNTTYRTHTDGSTGYDLISTFKLSGTAVTCKVYYKVNHCDISNIGIIPEGVTGDDLGYQNEWKFAGENSEMVIIPSVQVNDTYILKFVTEDQYGNKCDDGDITQQKITVVIKSTVPNVPQNFGYEFSKGRFRFYWDKVTNSDVDYYEVRYDQYTGRKNNLLGVTVNTELILPSLPKRRANVYVFAHNATKKYGYPARVNYDFPKPDAPVLNWKETLRGATVYSNNFPNEYINGLVLNFQGNGYSNTITLDNNNTISLNLDPDVYTVKGWFKDIFGEGYVSSEIMVTVKEYIDPSYIKEESLALEKMDKVIKGAVKDAQDSVGKISELNSSITELKQSDGEIQSTIADAKKNLVSQITQNTDKITSVVSSLKSVDAAKEAGFSVITQLQDGINLSVTKGDLENLGQDGTLMSYLNMTPSTVSINSSLLHITAKTLIDDDLITSGMIQAGAVTTEKISAGAITADKIAAGSVDASKIKVNSLSALSATIGTLQTSTSGARTVIKDNLIEVYDNNNVLRVRMGVW